jgi:hypothetical protein
MKVNQFISIMLFLSLSLYGVYIQYMNIPNLKDVLIIGLLNAFYTIGWYIFVFCLDWKQEPKTTHNKCYANKKRDKQ